MVRLIRCAIVVGALGVGVTASSAEYRIQRDFGGHIGSYLHKFGQVRESGQRVVIDGPCLGACTLALAVIPRDRLCMTPNAVLGFHAAWTPGAYGPVIAGVPANWMRDGTDRPIKSAGGTSLLMAAYPAKIKSWIIERGGLSGKMIFLRGLELASLYPTCN